MSCVTFHSPRWRHLTVAAVVAGVIGTAPAAAQPPQQGQKPEELVVQNGWTYTVEALATGVNNGFQLAMDPVNRRVYFGDAQWRVEKRTADGTVYVDQTGTGKLVEFDAATRSLVRVHSFLNLTRNDGNGKEGEPLDWTGVDGYTHASMRTTFSPYGIAIDPLAPGAGGKPDPLIITTTARGRDSAAGFGGNVVIYRASQGAPTDDDRLFEFEDGTPIFNGIRRVDVNTRTHKAFITGLGSPKIPGTIVMVDLLTKRPEARITVPGAAGAIGAAIDEARNLVYVGTMSGERLFVIDVARLDTSNPKDLAINDAAITELPGVVGGNARPTYNAKLQRLYVATYANPNGTISVVDANPQSARYGQVLETIKTGRTNMVEVDDERGLLYSANLQDQEVVAYDTTTHQELFRLPTKGAALNLAIDPVTRDLWVSNLGDNSFANVFRIQRVK